MRQTVRFYLNGELQQLATVNANQTLLQYLRSDAGLTGCKEGCAEGDCGACTVTEASLDGTGTVRYRALNACIRLLPTLDGCALWTVEGLTAADDRLHPVQQAMVDEHASQCGFCTPGFVMSLYSLYQNGERSLSRQRACQALSGNLCRCTGYRPILAAATRIGQYPPPANTQTDVPAQLRALQREQSLILQQQGLRFWAPLSTAELSALYLAHPDAVLLAGGTDIGLWLTKQLQTLPALIYLGQVRELQQIQHNEQHLRIGAGVLLEQAFTALLAAYPELDELWQRFASLPIRNAGTLVGNLANGSPIGDAAPALIALGAQLVLRRGEQQRLLPLEDLYLGYRQQSRQPGEWLEAVQIPRRRSGQQLAVYKLSKRWDQDISAVCAAFSIELAGEQVTAVRVAYGGMAATSRRAPAVEQALLGQPWNEASIQNAMSCLAHDFQPLSDMRASSHYRLTAAANLLYRFWLAGTTPQALRTGLGGVQ
ncbi:xanthine dehydrogenase small subunit [Neisseriaceae bacterium TC5R-5]|nr:xanthine dehydrogenase small subunit [Neisseriaceae bacterium TC5R-5]